MNEIAVTSYPEAIGETLKKIGTRRLKPNISIQALAEENIVGAGLSTPGTIFIK